MKCKPVGLIEALLPVTNSILGIRDSIGAVIQPVYFLTRTWYTDGTFTSASTNAGEGVAKDNVKQMLPSPQIVQLKQDLRLKEGGMAKNGDIMLKMISRDSYHESDLDGSSTAGNVEQLYVVGVKVYQVISVTESYVTWNVTIRELTNQTRY